MKVLSKKQVILMHEQLIKETGGTNGIRDVELLEAALFAPFQTFDGVELFPSVVEKAARLGFGQIKNHAFVDGNKRIGAHAMLVFLAVNGIEITYTQKELSDIILQAASEEKDYSELLLWLNTHMKV